MLGHRAGAVPGVLVALGVASVQTLDAQERSCRLAVTVGSEAGPVAGASVSALGHTVRTDERGHASIAVTGVDAAVMRVRRVGFAPAMRTVTPACDGAVSPVAVTLQAVVQQLAPVTVMAEERPRYTGPMAAFWERRARGDGYFFTAAEIDRRNVQRMSDLIRTVPGWARNQNQRTSDALIRGTAVRMGAMTRDAASRATTCYPTVVIDGMAATASELALDGIDPRSLAGVEIYVDGARTPSEFWGTAGQGRCGVVAVWSRRLDAMRHTPLEQQNAMVDTVYEADDVDRQAAFDGETSLPVLFPREMRRKRTSGSATLLFVVLPTGEPWLRDAR
ncbi:MAG: carboxypeptidase-like regulatory domain-containing protein, partial [Gemmatimonadaceae bacterium]|nr:carboxypeptidase-like regulatory domain-containing protein [Gemmatimonadaceae bacterium]